MTRAAALQIVEDLREYFDTEPHPGRSDGSIQFFTAKANQLSSSIDFNLETDAMLSWAKISYSVRKWEQWGYESIRTAMRQSIDCVRKRVTLAPDSVFDR